MSFYFGLTAALSAAGIVISKLIRNTRLANGVFCCLSFVTLATLSAFRYMVGFDYSYTYIPLYRPVLEHPQIAFGELPHEIGFVFLEKILARISPHAQLLFVVTSFLIIGLYMLYYYLYSPLPAVSVFLFLSLSQFYGSMNFIRQSLAAAICLFAIPLLQNRRFLPYAAVVLTAALFHQSALVMLAFYLVNLIPVSGYTLSIYVPLAVITYLSSTDLIHLVTRYHYQHYADNHNEVALGFEHGYLYGMLFLFILLFLARKYLLRPTGRNTIYLNYAFFALMFIFLGTKHAVLDRFTLYFEVAYPVAAAIALSELFGDIPKRATLRYAFCLFAMVVGISAIHAYNLHKDSHGVVPYRWIPSFSAANSVDPPGITDPVAMDLPEENDPRTLETIPEEQMEIFLLE